MRRLRPRQRAYMLLFHAAAVMGGAALFSRARCGGRWASSCSPLEWLGRRAVLRRYRDAAFAAHPSFRWPRRPAFHSHCRMAPLAAAAIVGYRGANFELSRPLLWRHRNRQPLNPRNTSSATFCPILSPVSARTRSSAPAIIAPSRPTMMSPDLRPPRAAALSGSTVSTMTAPSCVSPYGAAAALWDRGLLRGDADEGAAYAAVAHKLAEHEACGIGGNRKSRCLARP